ncbi:MAG: helix-turn-helix transcriptional regulator [Methylotenera sp.]|jgi:putative transcriptional regulator|nr:helix-turn-helix transcriptional regulator [Methylotenera sp.]MDO9389316.1 helix-turn-helix transcriptional regulator [Methylotenera sp.]
MITCKLSAILGERRIKIADVARDAGIGRATLDRWYHDKVSSYDRDVLSRLCDYLQVTPADLLKVVEQGKLF